VTNVYLAMVAGGLVYCLVRIVMARRRQKAKRWAPELRGHWDGPRIGSDVLVRMPPKKAERKRRRGGE
jgi:hypothetical protein